jgi:hypothetical protein
VPPNDTRLSRIGQSFAEGIDDCLACKAAPVSGRKNIQEGAFSRSDQNPFMQLDVLCCEVSPMDLAPFWVDPSHPCRHRDSEVTRGGFTSEIPYSNSAVS